MTSKKFKYSFIIAVSVLLFCSTGYADSSVYTVRLGEFKTLAAITEYYRLIPKKFHKTAMVCRSGNNFILNCGVYSQEKDIQPLFRNLKELGLNPRIIKQDFEHESAECGPANDFFVAASYAPIPQPKPAVVKQEVYADLKNPDVAGHLESASRAILPEATAKVYLSNRDVNRIICENGPIKDIVYSQEKGISVKTHQNNAFVKFLMGANQMSGDMMYSNIPSEIYVVCGSDSTVYTLIAEPRNIPAQTIELVSRKKNIRQTLSLFDGLAFEKKIIQLIQAAYKDEVADSFSVTSVNHPMNLFRDMDVLFSRQVIADGEGLILKEYILSMKSTSAAPALRLEEKFFMVPEITQYPLGISLEHMNLTMGQVSRLFVVEKHTD